MSTHSSDMLNPSFHSEIELSNEKILAWFQAEAIRFAEVVNTPGLYSTVMEYLSSSDTSKEGGKSKVRPPKAIKGHHVIDANKQSDWLWKILASAQVAVCCDLFRDCSVSLENIAQDEMRLLARNVVAQFLNSRSTEANNILKTKLHVADTIRIIQTLRKLGLYSRSAQSTKQLCMGAGLGIRDIDAMHAEVWLQKDTSKNIVSSRLQNQYVTFRARFPGVSHAILVDSAPALAEHYKENNSKPDGKIVALNQELFSALSWIASRIKSGEIEERNVAVGYRMDPRMIPDVSEFFERLSSVIGNTADFVVSIGAGNDAEEFRGRAEKMIEIECFLKKRHLDPVRIKLCSGDSIDEQRNSPLFGLLEITSYEVLYCKLKKKKIGVRT